MLFSCDGLRCLLHRFSLFPSDFFRRTSFNEKGEATGEALAFHLLLNIEQNIVQHNVISRT